MFPSPRWAVELRAHIRGSHARIGLDRPRRTTRGHSAALSRGMQGLAVRLARRINAEFDRHGRLFAQRYHARTLRTPREVRAVLRCPIAPARTWLAAGGWRRGGGLIDVDDVPGAG